jgi:hypothetical protein
MREHRSALAGITAAACAATLTIAACGGGGGNNLASFCKNYHSLSTVSGTDPATLQKAADLYRKLADDASGSIKDDLNLLADDEIKVKNGGAASVDNDAASAAANRVDGYGSSKC